MKGPYSFGSQSPCRLFIGEKFGIIAKLLTLLVFVFPVVLNAQKIDSSVPGATNPRTVNLHQVGGKKSDRPEIDPEIEKMLHFFEEKIYFTQNKGQWDNNILFKADFPLGKATAMKDGMLMTTLNADDMALRYKEGVKEEEARSRGEQYSSKATRLRGHSWKMKFTNSSDAMSIKSIKAHNETMNFFKGNIQSTDVATYQEIWYENVYSQVDVRYYPAVDGSLEYDLICKRGFNLSEINVELEGIDQIKINEKGSLIVTSSVGEMSLPAPIAYQMIGESKKYIDIEYIITGKNSYTFKIGSFDKNAPLIIDPIALRWATWVNSNSTGANHGHGIWVDPDDGAVYVVARVDGSTNFTTSGGFDNVSANDVDIIVGKYYPPAIVGGAGVRQWQTYIGGDEQDNPYAIELGPDGILYMTGLTESTDFPVIGGSQFGVTGGTNNQSQAVGDIFVLKISQNGTSIKAAVVGGDQSEASYDLRILTNGDILVCGTTESDNLNTLYPGLGAAASSGSDGLIFKINQSLTTLSWIRNFGGTDSEIAYIMNLNPVTNEIFIGGYTSSTNFPLLNPRQNARGGDSAGFLRKLNSNGLPLWSSYFRTANNKTARILCMEFNSSRNRIYFGGYTSGLYTTNPSSAASNLPTGGYDLTYNSGDNDFFVACMDTSQTLIQSTYIGGSGNEVNMMGLNVDLNNDVYVFGYTNSNNFPVTSDALQSLLNTTGSGTNNDKVFFKLPSTLAASPLYSTYYGGTQDDYDPVGERGIKFSACRIYTIVTSESNNIPLTQGALTTLKSSSNSIYEPGLVVWANPPDLSNNAITGSQVICSGTQPASITGSVPSYLLPNISRNNVNTPYPVTLPSAATYTWQWSTDNSTWTNIPGGNTQNLAGNLVGVLTTTTYFRRIIGGDACILPDAADQTVTVTVFNVPGVVTNVTCFGLNNGSITATPQGTGPFTYVWSNGGGNTPTISGLAPGPYSVTVTAANGCIAVGNFTITQPAVLAATISAIPSSCGGPTGSAAVVASGGTSPYTYLWSNGGTLASITNVSAGSYSVTVTDAKGCTIVKQIDVTSLSNLSGIIANQTPPTCYGGADGTVTVNGTNGILPYQYSKNGGPFGPSNVFAGLSAGSYTITIKDNSGCTYSVNVVISNPQIPDTCPDDLTVQCGTPTTPNITGTPATDCDNTWTYVDADCLEALGPNEGQICFEGTDNPVGATSKYVINYTTNNNGTITIRTTLSKNFVDNTYGATRIGWMPANHTFSNLTGSDQLQLALFDANNVKKLEFKMDYLSSSASAPSGYKSLGISGGDGALVVGNAAFVTNVVTSLDVNFNQYGYVETTNSPATDVNYTPNAGFPNWIFEVWYECTVDLAAFGAAGFGTIDITGIHASPSKTGNNTENVDPVDCPDPCAGVNEDPCDFNIYRTWTSALTGATCEQVINVKDTTDPVLHNVPADATVECSNIPAPSTAVYATDLCDLSVVPVYSQTIVPGTACSYTIIRTWTATDDCGNSKSATQTLTVTDTTDPELVGVPANTTVQCDAIPAAPTVMGTDNCDTNVFVDYDEEISVGCPYSITRTWTAYDECGNTATGVQVINVIDNTFPVLYNVPADATIECTLPIPDAVVTASDNCTNDIAVVLDANTIPQSCGYLFVRTWTATDACGNKTEKSQTITVIDTGKPVLHNVPADATVECSNIPAPSTAVYATDLCDLSVVPVYSQTIVPGTACSYTIIRTWTATDDCGNSKSATQTLTVTDTIDPTLIGVPANTTVECDAIPTAPTVMGTDNCDTDVFVDYDEDITDGCPYTITRTWTAYDECGNTAVGVQVITVNDSTFPVLYGVPADETIECTTPITDAVVTASDNCTDDIAVVLDANTIPQECGYLFVRTWTATDACGNKTEKSQIITVRDTVKPVLHNVPASATVECSNIPAPSTAVYATDNCDNSVVPVYSQTIVPGDACTYTIIRTWTATDSCDNTETATQTLTVTDTIDPQLVGVPANTTVECDAIPAAPTVMGTDNCDTDVFVDFDEVISTGCPYTITRTWTAYDNCNNTAVGVQVITVNDSTFPVLYGVPADETIECTTPITDAVVTASDNCTDDIAVVLDANTIPQDCGYLFVRTWTATDDCGNKTEKSQTITVRDTVKPVLHNVPADATVECSNIPAPSTAVYATDNCDLSVVPVYSQTIVPGDAGDACTYKIIRTWTATDNCDNTQTATQTLTVTDTIDPQLVGVPANTTVECDAIPAAPTVMGTDNCDTDVFVDYDEDITDGCPYTITRTWTAYDECGNTAVGVQVITVNDSTFPVLYGVPADETIECTTPITDAVVTASDNCTDDIAVVLDANTIPQDCGYLFVRTWTATDDCGNKTEKSQTITVRDTVKPVLHNVPASATVECSNIPAPSTAVYATDNCDNSVVPVYSQTIVPGDACTYTIIRTWTVTDNCDNTETATQTLTVTDTIDPTLIGVPANTTVECDAIPTAPTVMGGDNCDNNVEVTYDEDITEGCPYTITRTWTATDNCGNTYSASQVITVEDNTYPVLFGVPADAELDCTLPIPNAVVFATDNCTDDIAVVLDANTIPQECGYLFVRTWTATDDCGNKTEKSQTITVVDTQDPVLANVPADFIGQCGDVPEPSVVTASDNCDTDIFIDYDETVIGTSCPISILRTWTAYDDCGNTDVATQTITINDTVDPVLVGVPASTQVECDEVPAPAAVTATDNCAFDLEVIYSQDSIPANCGYTLIRHWSVVDYCGNDASASQTLSVYDNTKPVLHNVPADATVECSNIPAPSTAVYATDNCDNSVVPVYSQTIVPGDACTYTIIRTWTVTDNCDNTETATQTLTVTDTIDPTLIGVPANTTVECDAIPTAPTVMGGDNCDNNVEVTYDEDITEGCPYTITRTWTATDNCGNTYSASQVITVEDNTYPVLFGVPADAELDCTLPIPNAVVFATDNCTDDIAVVLDANTIPQECGYLFVRTWTATDDCGNKTEKSQTITVVDTQDPVLANVPADFVGQCGDIPEPSVVTASDNCDTDVFIDYDEQVLGESCPVSILRTWTAYDDCGNTDVATQMITISDTVDPILVGVPTSTQVECDEVPAPAAVTATDNCAYDLDVIYSQDSINAGCGYTLIRHWSVVDYCGNDATASQTLSVYDNTKPVLHNVPADATVECSNIPAPSTAVYATDNCDNSVVPVYNQTIVPGDACTYTIIRTWTATDNCDNTETATQTLTVTDTIDPTLIGVPANTTVECDAIPTAPTVMGGDNCDNNVEVAYDEDITEGCPYTITRTWTATDNCGNTYSASQVITVEDNTYPVLYGVPADAELDCTLPIPNAVVFALDNCTDEIAVELEANTIPQECGYLFVRTWTATDDCGNKTEKTQTITVVDTADPVLANVPADFVGQCGDIPEPSVVTASDNCDTDVFIDYDEQVLGTSCPVSIIRTWTAYDDCGNTDVATQMITISDTVDPILVGVPTSTQVECDNVPAPAAVTATDNCAYDLDVIYSQDSINAGCGYTLIRHWSVVDYCGNEATASQTIIVVDTTEPQANVEDSEITVECSDEIPAFNPTFTDNCDDDLTVSAISATGFEGCVQWISTVYSAEDNCGNIGSVYRTVRIVDTTDPFITNALEDQFVQCGDDYELETPTFDDLCDDDLTVTYEEEIQNLPQGYVIIRRFTATDDCGNSITDESQIVVLTTTVPVLINLPQLNVILSCSDDIPSAAIVVGEDYCGNPLDVDFEESETGDDCNRIITRTWTVTDAAGNVTSETQTIQIIDNTPPTITCPANVTVTCSSLVPAADYSNVDAEDDCNDVTISHNDVIIDYICADKYKIVRTYTATDDCDNAASCEQLIIVNDNIAPVFTFIPESAANCGEAVEFVTPTAVDNCGSEVVLTYEDITDNDNGNSDDDCQYTTFSQGGWGTSANGNNPGVYRDANFAGAFPNGLTVGCNVGSYLFNSSLAIENFLPAGGPSSVLAPGNVVNPTNVQNQLASQLVAATLNVGFDSYDPNFGDSNGFIGNLVFANGTFAGQSVSSVMQIANNVLGGCSNAYSLQSLASAMEDINLSFHEGNTNSGDLLCDDGGENNLCEFNVTRVWTATDACGNSSTAEQTVSISDNEDPTVEYAPVNSTIECGALIPNDEPVFEDNCDDDLTITFVEDQNELECGYEIVRSWRAEDNCGNYVIVSQTITIEDNNAPVLSGVPGNVSQNCGELPAIADVTAFDICDGSVEVDYSQSGYQDGCYYNIVRTWTATDACGNEISASQTIIVGDNVDPVVESAPADNTIDCQDELPSVEEPTFSDNCDNDLDIDFEIETVDLECGYAIKRTWTATDNCGNTAVVVHNVFVTDSEAPVVDPYVIYQQVECSLVDGYLGITATDNCGDVTITYEDDIFSGGCLGVLVRTYTITDECGNSTTAQQILTILDTEGPIIMNPADDTVQCDEAPTAIPNITIYDACGLEVEIISATQEIVELDGCSYQIIWHWEAMDYCENISEATTVITVVDTESPVFNNIPENRTISCDETFEAPVAPTATDNCTEFVIVESSSVTVPGACPQEYYIYYTWRASDECENDLVETTIYHIIDNTAPEFSDDNISTFSYECDEVVPVVTPVATDNCGDVTLDHSDSEMWNDGCVSGFTRNWIATDECDNTSSFIQYITIVDTTAPVVVGDFEVTIECDAVLDIYITATDNCQEVDIDYVDEHVSGSCAGRIIRTYTVSDGCGNSTEFVQFINLIDVVDPVSTTPISDLTIECGDSYEAYEPTFTDNCDQELTIEAISGISVSEDGCTQYISQSWIATDDCNNSTTVSRLITIVDTTAPEFDSVPENLSLDCSDEVEVADVTATDACADVVDVDYSDEIEEGNCPSNYTIVRTWTASDNCGNVATHVQYITVSDETAPVIVAPQGGYFACDAFEGAEDATATDNCSSYTLDHADSYEPFSNNEYCGVLLTRTFTAVDACGNTSYASTEYFLYDNEAPTFNEELSDVTVECASEIPAPLVVTANDNCSDATVVPSVTTIESADDCGNQILYVNYTATDECGNSAMTGYYIYVLDTTEPVLSGCPQDLVLDCDGEIPAAVLVTAFDNCGGELEVEFEEFMHGDLPAEGSIADCNLITPVRPANNPCVYPYDWAMALFGLPSAHKYYSISEGNLVRYPNGSIHITGKMKNVITPANGWNIDVWFNGEKTWNQWISQAFPTSFKADCGGEAINHTDWLYFILQAGAGAELTGFGGYNGSTLNMVHAPSNNYFGFQLGDGANNYNGAENGFGGWFSYSGTFMINNVAYGNNNGNISGAGDLAFELDCCPDYSIERQWTATDCSGNSVSCTQYITFDGQGTNQVNLGKNPQTVTVDNNAVVSVFPNPAISTATFKFKSTEAAKTRLEIYDVAGALVATVYNGVVEANLEYNVNVDVRTFATGVYVYRFVSGDHTDVGRMIINR